MTHRSRNGGPAKTHRKQQVNNGQPRKLHHPPPAVNRDETASGSKQKHPAASSPTDQEILDIIHAALHDTLTSTTFIPTVQKIKSLLYEAKWLEVFTNPDLLQVYAGRWVPSRALCFRELFVSLPDVARMLLSDRQHLRVVSLGGGAGSELLALAAVLAYRDGCPIGGGDEVEAEDESDAENDEGSAKAVDSVTEDKSCEVEWIGADIGNWTGVLGRFEATAKDKWSLGGLKTRYIEGDLLGADSAIINVLNGGLKVHQTLVTILFTWTELLSQSPTGSIALLRSLTDTLPSGSLLLVVDSASDIASFSLGSERKWPTYTILEMTLERLVSGPETPGPPWELLAGNDSRWFRLGEDVGGGWPAKLENTRYWFRLYRKL